MNVTVLETKEVAIKLKKLMDNYDEYYWAVAWASSKIALADELIQRKNKIKRIIIGIDFDQTDPEFLDKMTSVSASRVAIHPDGIFHPKVYYFQSKRQAAAIVGSANFTRGGTELNVELSILIEGKSDDEQLISIKNIVSTLWKRGEKITHNLADQYRERHNSSRDIRDRLKEKFILKKVADNSDDNRKQLIESAKLKALLADEELQSNENSLPGYHAFKFAREQLAKYAYIPDNISFIEYFQRDIVKKSFVQQAEPELDARKIRGRASKVRRKVRIACIKHGWSDEEIKLLNISPTGSMRTTSKSSLATLAALGYQEKYKS